MDIKIAKQYTLKDVAQHNTASSCWVALNGRVLDVTSLVNVHPGGARNILNNAGTDVSQIFNSVHPLRAQEAAERYVIGNLAAVDEVPVLSDDTEKLPKQMNVPTAATFEFPIIDFELLERRDPIECDRLALAATQIGFWLLSNCPVDRAPITKLSRNFFALPLSEKLESAMQPEKSFYGYSVWGSEKTLSIPDSNESFNIFSDVTPYGPDHPYAKNFAPVKTPSSLPEFQSIISSYFNSMSRVAKAVLEALAVGLEYPSDFFTSFKGDPFCYMRFMRYKAHSVHSPRSPNETIVGVGAHTDNGYLTLIAQDGQGGLQTWSEGEWRDVPCIPGTFVVNMGDSLSELTKGLCLATPHRVIIKDPSKERFSIPYFWDPNLDTPIKGVANTSPKHSPRKGYEGEMATRECEADSVQGEYILSTWTRSYRGK